MGEKTGGSWQGRLDEWEKTILEAGAHSRFKFR
jgi:hypothetical protein